MPTLTTFIEHSIGSSSHSAEKEKKIRDIQIGKEEVKLSHCLYLVNDMILHIENPKYFTKKLLELL